MQVMEQSWEPSLEILLTPDEARVLKELSEQHYDMKCRLAGERGFINGIYNTRVVFAEEAPVPWRCSQDDIDTMLKLLEQRAWLKDPLRQVAVRLNQDLREAFDELSNLYWSIHTHGC